MWKYSACAEVNVEKTLVWLESVLTVNWQEEKGEAGHDLS